MDTNMEQPYLPGLEDYKIETAEDLIKLDKKLYNNNFYFQKCIPLIDLIETYQGEGPNCGKKMVLARFKYCNKHCPFCDTWNMMKDTEKNLVSLKDIDLMLKSSHNFMITGGEPTLKNSVSKNSMELPQFHCTIAMATFLNYKFLDIETNGFNLKELIESVDFIKQNSDKNINISWSPKFINDTDFDENIENVINCNNENVTMKVVIGEDMDAYKRFVYKAIFDYGWDNNRLYLMPKGTTLDEINNSMKSVLSIASDVSCNISTRLHIVHNFK